MGERPARPVVLLTTGSEEYQARLLRGILPVLDRCGLSRIIYMDRWAIERLPGDIAAFLRHADPLGVICTHLLRERHLRDLTDLVAQLALPTVLISSEVAGHACVTGDNRSGMRALMGHLLDECGVRRPVLVRGIAFQRDALEREAVFREELAARGIGVDEDLVIDGEFWVDTAYQAMSGLLRRRRDFDAVVACNDISARACIGVLSRAGLRVPEDVLVTGFDNDQDALQWPGLTTVDPNLPEQGRVAAELFLAQLDGTGERSAIVVPSRLIVRASTSTGPRAAEEQLEIALGTVAAAQASIDRQQASESLTRATLTSQTLDQVLAALVSCLSWLRIRRCFVAVRADLCGELAEMPIDWPAEAVDDADRAGGGSSAGGDGGDDGLAGAGKTPAVRLLLDYRDGTLNAPSALPYPAHRLLPDDLQGELRHGLLSVFALVRDSREFGFMILERSPTARAFNETLNVNLSSALDAVLSRRALQAYAARLETTVGRRTDELRRRTEELSRQARELAIRTEELQAEIGTRQRAEQQLQVANDELRQAAMRDGLTGIANRAAFEQHLRHHWAMLTSIRRPMALLLVDVDLFKRYNDCYGHIAGDNTLRVVAQCLQRATCRCDDLAARYGGEEFVVVLPNAGAHAGLTVAERFQSLLAAEAIEHLDSDVAPVVTASVGVAVAQPGHDCAATDLLAAADQALYRAKEMGRNRAVLVSAHPTL